MEVINPMNTLLTNAEVLALLRETKAKSNTKGKRSKNHATIVYETTKYLENTPAVVQRKSDIEKLIRSVGKFKLMPAEIMQIINLRPISLVELQLVVEESEERLSVDQVEELLRIISDCLPEPPKKSEE